MAARPPVPRKPEPAAARPAAPAAAPAAPPRPQPQPPAPPPPLPEVRPVTVAVGPPGHTIQFPIANEPGHPLYFALGVRKSGSTLLARVVNFLARRNGMNPVDMPGTFFKFGFTVADWTKVDLSDVIAPGNVYIGFRALPSNLASRPDFRQARKVFMFRDPRDALVSQYFSDAYSHSLPSRDTETGAKAAEAFEKRRAETLATDIEAYVLKHARALDQTLLAYAPLLQDPNCLAMRYEDFVFQKKRMIHKILQHFDWSCPPGVVEALMKQVDEVPETEDKARFVRRVIPGDHRAKLAPESVRKLNVPLRESLRVFDYY